MMDSILIWNEVALDANRVSHTEADKAEQQGPTLSSRALAIVHLAMYDAYAGVRGNPAELPAYMPDLPPAPQGASPQAAVAGAAHFTLSELYKRQQPTFDRALNDHGDPRNPGHRYGVAVAQAILNERSRDPGAGDVDPNNPGERYRPSDQPFRHRPDPDNPGQGFHAPYYGARSKGFAITARHTLESPPRGDGEYLRALREVRVAGILPELTGALPEDLEDDDDQRTPERSVIGVFWGYDGAIDLGTPPRLYNQIIRRVAMARRNNEDQNARLFALVNVAMGDAGILAWDQKYIHDLWRPVVGIREHDRSFGPTAPESNNDLSDDADPMWLPFGAPKSNILNKAAYLAAPMEPPTNRSLTPSPAGGASPPGASGDDARLRCAMCLTLNKNFTPNFPAYPSGHATFGAAAFHITRLFYGIPVRHRGPDNLFDGIDVVSDEFNGKTQDHRGTVRPRHRRDFPDGLWQMIIENGLSRVYLGVHWVFDAFATGRDGRPHLSKNVGGVPLGLRIAEDIFQSGMRRSSVAPRST